MTGGAYLLIFCSIVFLSMGLIPILREKDKQMKVRQLILGGIVFIVTLGILFGMSVLWDKDETDSPVPPLATRIADADPFHPLVPATQGDMPVNTEDRQVNTEDVKMEITLTSDMEDLLEQWNSHRTLRDSDKRAISAMMAQFEGLERMSESDILNKLIGFLPEAYQKNKGHVQLVTKYYQGLRDRPGTPYKVDQKVLITVSYVHQIVESYKNMITHGAEAARRDAALMAADTELYYETKIQEMRDQIEVTEKSIREAEAEGDSDRAELLRGGLASYRRHIKSYESQRDFDENVDAMIQKRLKEELPQIEADYQKRVNEIMAELGLDPLTTAAIPTDAISDTSFSPTVSPTDTVLSEQLPPVTDPSGAYDPIRSLTSAQNAITPWRATLDKQYRDVLLSQQWTPTQLQQFLPSQQHRNQLKYRTAEMRRAVESKVHRVVSEIQGATAEQKREIARQLVSSNFDKDFAESVMKRLRFDDK